MHLVALLGLQLGQFLGRRRRTAVEPDVAQLQPAILDSLPAHLAVLDASGHVLSINQAWASFASRHDSVLHACRIGADYLAAGASSVVIPGREGSSVASEIRRVLTGELPLFEVEHTCGLGEARHWFRMFVTPLGAGKPPGAVVMHLDITASKLAREALERSEQRYRLLSRATTEIIYEWDVPADRRSWSEGMTSVLGYAPHGTTGAWWADHIHPDDRAQTTASLSAALAGSVETWSAVYRFRRADGDYGIVADRGYLVRGQQGEAIRLIGAMSDITQRKLAEERTRRSEATLAAAQRVAHLGSWGVNLQDHTSTWSDEMYRILGLECGKGLVPVERLLSHAHPDDQAAVAAAIDRALGTQQGFDVEFRIVRPNGEVREVRARGQVEQAGGAAPAYAIGILQDMTEQRLAERRLQQREERLRLLNAIATGMRTATNVADTIHHVVQQVWEHLPDCRVTYSTVNDYSLRIISCRHPEDMADLTGFEADLRQAPDYLRRLAARGPMTFRNIDTDPGFSALLGGRAVASRTLLAMPLQHAGQLLGLVGVSSSHDREWGEHEIDLLREIGDYLSVAITRARAQTEREQAMRDLELSQEQLRELARQLRDAGEKERAKIAREIHDVLGQALTALQMEVALLVQRMGEPLAGTKLQNLIDLTIDSVQRLAADLRPSHLDDLGLNAAILWEAGELHARSGLRCECVLPEADLPLSPDQSTGIFRILQEALTNVVRHARARRVRIRLTGTAGVCRLEVTDDGAGIARDALTNPDSLGLVGMRERAIALQGRLDIEAAPRRGTRVRVSIPMTRPATLADA